MVDTKGPRTSTRDATRTELVWPGKRTQVERVALPFQVAETINQSRATREQAPMFARGGAVDDGTWTNKLIWDDNRYIIPSLAHGDSSIGLEPLAGKVDLIYIDPPFATGTDFGYTIPIGDDDIEITKTQSVIEEKAYRDTWKMGLETYLPMMYERLTLIRELLSDKGNLFVHLDATVVHYVKAMCDELFGRGARSGEPGFRSEIIWFHNVLGTGTRVFPKSHETILWYSKSGDWYIDSTSEHVRVPYSERITGTLQQDERGWYYVRGNRDSSGHVSGKWFRTYVDLEEIKKGKLAADVWDDIKSYRAQGDQRTGFATQKPERLLQRIVGGFSAEGDLVADFFSGSGTAVVVAEKLDRRWIACDLSRYAIQVSRKRMLDIDGCRPFQVLNLGRYERKHWQVNVMNGHQDADKSVADYYRFIVALYHAEPAGSYVHLHGQKAGRWIHVGPADSPVTRVEVMDATHECAANHYGGLDVLGWEWELGLHDTIRDEAKRAGVDLHLLVIPREVMDQQAVQAGDVHFYELAFLKTTADLDKRQVVLKLEDFIIPNPELVPDEVRSKVKKWSDYVDFWGVDWNYQGDTFHNEWQTYRTRKSPTLRLLSDPHVYDGPGTYQVMVKVIDIFGNDTTQIHEVTVS